MKFQQTGCWRPLGGHGHVGPELSSAGTAAAREANPGCFRSLFAPFRGLNETPGHAKWGSLVPDMSGQFWSMWTQTSKKGKFFYSYWEVIPDAPSPQKPHIQAQSLPNTDPFIQQPAGGGLGACDVSCWQEPGRAREGHHSGLGEPPGKPTEVAFEMKPAEMGPPNMCTVASCTHASGSRVARRCWLCVVCYSCGERVCR